MVKRKRKPDISDWDNPRCGMSILEQAEEKIQSNQKISETDQDVE